MAARETSIVFGYDAPEYTTSKARMDAQVGKAAVLRAGNDRSNLNKECHVVFGEPGVARDFTRSSTQVNPTGSMQAFTTHLSARDKCALVQTSCVLGHDAPTLRSSTQDATRWSREEAARTIALRNEIRKHTGPRPTRGMSYDDEVEYVSEVQSAFTNRTSEFRPTTLDAALRSGEDHGMAALRGQRQRLTLCCRSAGDSLLTGLRATSVRDLEPHRAAESTGLCQVRDAAVATARSEEGERDHRVTNRNRGALLCLRR